MNKLIIFAFVFFVELTHNNVAKEVFGIVWPLSHDDKDNNTTNKNNKENNSDNTIEDDAIEENATDDYSIMLRSLLAKEKQSQNENHELPFDFDKIFLESQQSDYLGNMRSISPWKSIEHSRNHQLTTANRYKFDAEPPTYTQMFGDLLNRFAELKDNGFDIRGPMINKNKSDPFYEQFLHHLSLPLDSHLKSLKCPNSITTVNGEQVCRGALIFQDNFRTINSSKWLIERKIATGPDYEFVVYMDNPLCIFTKHGKLQIKPTRLENIFGENAHLMDLSLGENCTGTFDTHQCRKTNSNLITQPIISGRLTTRHIFQFLYGRIEIRARLPAGDWIFPQLLLESATNAYGKNRLDSGQMRIAFINGNNRSRLYGGPLFGAEEPMRTIKMCEYKTTNVTTDWTKKMHNYTLEWRPTGILLAVDGIEYCNIKPDDVDKDNGFSAINVNGTQSTAAIYWRNSGIMAPFDKEFYLTIGVGVGGFNDYPDEIVKRNKKTRKPWENYSLQAMRDFYDVVRLEKNWPLPKKSILKVESIRVYAL